MTETAIDAVEDQYDSRYLKKYSWPGVLTTGEMGEVVPMEVLLYENALECFINHNALVDQIRNEK